MNTNDVEQVSSSLIELLGILNETLRAKTMSSSDLFRENAKIQNEKIFSLNDDDTRFG